MRTKFTLSIVSMLLLLTLTQCKKESTSTQLPPNVSPSAKEYVTFKVEGLTGLTTFTFQDVDGYVFKGYHDRCPLSPTYVLHEVAKQTDPYNNPRFTIYLGTAKQPTKFSDGVKVQPYAVNSLQDGNAAVSFCHNNVNNGGLCASTMNTTPGNYFEVKKLKRKELPNMPLGNSNIRTHSFTGQHCLFLDARRPFQNKNITAQKALVWKVGLAKRIFFRPSCFLNTRAKDKDLLKVTSKVQLSLNEKLLHY